MPTGAVCELKESDITCGVTAIGRCHTCKRAFCGSHQGYDYKSGFRPQPRYIDECLECTHEKEAQYKHERALAMNHKPLLRERITAVAKSMADAKTPGRVSRRRWKGTKKGGFLHPSENIYEELETAWPVGTHGWYHGGDLESPQPLGVTAAGEIVALEASNEYGAKFGVVQYSSEAEGGHLLNYSFRMKNIDDGQYYCSDKESLEKIRVALEAIAQHHGVSLDPWQWPPADYRD